MTRVMFSIDGHGPFEGNMKTNIHGNAEIEFVSIPIRATELTAAKTIRVESEGDEPFEAPVIRITTEGGYREEFDDRMTGYVVFETV